MHVWALANQKGGCGKTTTAVNLSAALARRGQRVLLVDLDPQAHATLALGRISEEGSSITGVLCDGLSLREAIVRAPGRFDLVPADLDLAEFEEVAERMLRPERVLAGALLAESASYDHVLIDCPPRADGVLTANAVRAADTVVLVVETGVFALQGAVRARRLLEQRTRERRTPPRWRVVATLFDRRLRIEREVLVAIHARFGDELFETAIRSSVRLREAAAFGLPVHELDPRCSAAGDFEALGDELLAATPHPAAGETLREVTLAPRPAPEAIRAIRASRLAPRSPGSPGSEPAAPSVPTVADSMPQPEEG